MRRIVLTALGAVVVGFAALAFLRTLDAAGAGAVPPGAVLAGVLAVAVASQVLGAWGWLGLVGGRGDEGLLRSSFHASQLAKYVPVGLAQAAGQIALARRAGMAAADATFSWIVLGLLTGAAGLVVGVGAALVDNGLDGTQRLALALGPLAAVAVSRPVLARVHGWLARRWRTLGERVAVPPQEGLWRCFVTRLAWILAQGGAFASILRSLAPVPLVTAVTAFALAFALGLAVVVVPSGVAVREAVLVVALAPFAPGAVVVTAAVWHRLVVIAAELVVVAGSTVRGRSSGRGRGGRSVGAPTAPA